VIVKNLIALTQGASIGDLTSLEELVSVVMSLKGRYEKCPDSIVDSIASLAYMNNHIVVLAFLR